MRMYKILRIRIITRKSDINFPTDTGVMDVVREHKEQFFDERFEASVVESKPWNVRKRPQELPSPGP